MTAEFDWLSVDRVHCHAIKKMNRKPSSYIAGIAYVASVSAGLENKEERDFRCFARAKNGARAKKQFFSSGFYDPEDTLSLRKLKHRARRSKFEQVQRNRLLNSRLILPMSTFTKLFLLSRCYLK